MEYPGVNSKPFFMVLGSGHWARKDDILKSSGGILVRVEHVYERRWYHRWLRKIVRVLYAEFIFPDWQGRVKVRYIE